MFWNKEKNRLQAELIEERRKADQAAERARQAEAQLAIFKSKPTLYCSFCSKSQHQVHQLIAGPTVFICNECVHLCIEVLENGQRKTGGNA